MLVSKIKPCMSKYKQLYCETANGSLMGHFIDSAGCHPQQRPSVGIVERYAWQTRSRRDPVQRLKGNWPIDFG